MLGIQRVTGLVLHLQRLLTAIALGAAALFFTLLALRDEVHLFPVGLGDSLGHYALVESAQQLLDSFPIASFDSHSFA